jgi:hypothetical protein
MWALKIGFIFYPVFGTSRKLAAKLSGYQVYVHFRHCVSACSILVLEVTSQTRAWRFHLVLLFGIASVVIAFALVWISYLS